MRRFLASAWFPFVACLALAAVSTGAYALMRPTGEDVGNSQIIAAFQIAGWAAGGVMAVLSLFFVFVLNGVRRIIRVRRVRWLHPVVVLAGLLPWMLFGWNLVMVEPRYTPFARAAIDFVGKQMFLGAFGAAVLVIVLSLGLLLPSKK